MNTIKQLWRWATMMEVTKIQLGCIVLAVTHPKNYLGWGLMALEIWILVAIILYLKMVLSA